MAAQRTEDTQWAFWDGMNEYQKKNKDYLQGQIGNPEGPEKPNKKYYDPRMSLRSGEEMMANRLVKCMEGCAVALAGAGAYAAAQALAAEARAAKAELGALRAARAAATAEDFETGQERMAEWASRIRVTTQEAAAMQAQQHMTQAHLKALQAMISSTAGQVRSREAVLYGVLGQAEEYEAAALSAQQNEAHAAAEATVSPAQEDPEEAMLKQRLWQLTASCDRLVDEVHSARHERSAEARTLKALSYTEDRLAEFRHEAARLSAEVSQPAPARLQDLRSSRLRGSRASASEALFTEEAVLRAEEEASRAFEECSLPNLHAELVSLGLISRYDAMIAVTMSSSSSRVLAEGNANQCDVRRPRKRPRMLPKTREKRTQCPEAQLYRLLRRLRPERRRHLAERFSQAQRLALERWTAGSAARAEEATEGLLQATGNATTPFRVPAAKDYGGPAPRTPRIFAKPYDAVFQQNGYTMYRE
ncbi:Fructose-bisphosphate aldolase [Symbiodinium microadriaticum]|uniref:Fructose-bisphosphate aldolase n=1 Tax=Symbiodinium microadriaticum TaxID=2951 RepID=A0A1Q9DXM0_SYMMI|nr:Fructose-bisphosphate aldolase [Symbiodinium microadriaticum]